MERSPESAGLSLEEDRNLPAIQALRFLAVDMVEAAQSGHPGAPMGQAPMAYLLWTRFLRHHPAHPEWPNRDRFVLSCGHASALIYGLLHLAGYDLPMTELKSFRSLHSKTPGHPEHGHTPGIETTTGPLGQGIATAVGMAMAERQLAARYNRPGFDLIDYRTWVIASDGDLMEGISAEACSFAGHQRLGKLNVLWDDNEISIDGATSISFSEDVPARFAAVGWHVIRVEDGNDLTELANAMAAAQAETGRPTLIAVRTHIGYGSPNKQGTAASHGSPLGKDEVAATKTALSWPLEPTFHVPEEARLPFRDAAERGRQAEEAWTDLRRRWASENPEVAAELDRRWRGELPAGWQDALPSFAGGESPATRKASGQVLACLGSLLPELTGGSADLTGSNLTLLPDEADASAQAPGGRNLRFGVREHAMGAILNGMALSRSFVPYGGTFLVFADYMRPAIRLAAMMGLQVIYVLTHDSIFLGEDGPTHQPESHLASLRCLPNLVVLRPCDGNETAAAWQVAIERRQGPTVLSLTRQGLPVSEESQRLARGGVAQGAYVLREATNGAAQAILIGTGSEVAICLDAQEVLAAEGIACRVVSMPSWELFTAQSQEVRDAVLPPDLPVRLAVETGSSQGWHRWVGDRGDVLALDSWGASAPWKALAEEFGFTGEAVAARMRALLAP